MFSAKKKTTEPAPMSPLRHELGEAIQKRDESREYAESCHKALAAAKAARDAAWRVRLAAEEAVEAAPEAMKTFMIASARGENVPRPPTIKECRADLEEAVVGYQAATDAFNMMDEEVRVRGNPTYYEGQVKILAARIVQDAPATAALIAEALEIRRQLEEKWHMLRWIAELKPYEHGAPSTDIAGAVDRLGRPFTAWETAHKSEGVRKTAALAPWAQAFEALLLDAGAEIGV